MEENKTNKNPKLFLAGIPALLIVAGFCLYYFFLAAPKGKAPTDVFSLTANQTALNTIANNLHRQGFIKSPAAFKIILQLKNSSIDSGGYRISKSMNAWQIAQKITGQPELKWVTIPEGWRKEQIANRLAEELNWSREEKENWIYNYTTMEYDYIEGVYFPDTYLIPLDESGLEVAQRMINRFKEKFAPYYDKFLEKDIKWTTALKLASLVQREAGGKGDMPIVAGILWNRLLEDTKLEVDATIQYIRDDEEEITDNFWRPIKPADKEIESQYNTYKNKGLPLFPICNPGLDAIEAVLNPAETDCFYYLHEPSGQIHCAETYQGHLENIEKYLK